MRKILSFCLLVSFSGPLNAADAARTYVAARHIRAGEVITADALREADAVPGAATAALTELTGFETVRPVRAGEVVTRLMVRPARAVRPGDKIKVGTALGRLKVSMWFTALQGGAKGETIDARNQASGRVCQVRVEGPGEGSLGEAKK